MFVTGDGRSAAGKHKDNLDPTEFSAFAWASTDSSMVLHVGDAAAHLEQLIVHERR